MKKCNCKNFSTAIYASRQCKKDEKGRLIIEPIQDEGLGTIICNDCETEYTPSQFFQALPYNEYKKTLPQEQQDKIEDRINEMMTYDRNEPNERTELIDELYSFWAIDALLENNEL